MGSEWKSVPFRELYAIPSRNGLTKPKKIRGEGYKFINMGEIFSYGRMLNIECDRAPATDKELETSTLKAGDLLFARQSLVLSGAGKCSIFLGDDETTIFESHLIRVRPDAKQVLPEYLYYYFDSPIGRSEIWSITEQGAGQAGIRGSDLETVLVRLPSLAKQEKIVSILQAIDNKIALNRQINTTLESMAQALFKSWFVDFDPVIDNALAAGHEIPDALQKRAARREALRQQSNKTANETSNKTTGATDAASSEQALPETGLSDQRLPPEIQQLFPDRFVFTEEMGWVPEGWEVQPFGDLIETTIGGDWGKEVPDDKHTHRVGIIRGTDLPTVRSASKGAIPFRWVEDKKFKTRELVDGDLVIEVSGGSPKQPTGRSTYITQDTVNMLEGSVVAASFCRKLRPVSKHVGLLLALHLDRIYGEGKMWGYQNQSTGISNFQTKVFLESEFVITPNKEELLVRFFEIVRPLINKSRSNDSETLADIRDSLLPKLLSGQITIPDAEQQLAEVL